MTLGSLIELLDDKELTETFDKLPTLTRYDVKKIEEEEDDGR